MLEERALNVAYRRVVQYLIEPTPAGYNELRRWLSAWPDSRCWVLSSDLFEQEYRLEQRDCDRRQCSCPGCGQPGYALAARLGGHLPLAAFTPRPQKYKSLLLRWLRAKLTNRAVYLCEKHWIERDAWLDHYDLYQYRKKQVQTDREFSHYALSTLLLQTARIRNKIDNAGGEC